MTNTTTISGILFGVILVSFFAVGWSLMIGESTVSYGVSTNSSILNDFNKMDDARSNIDFGTDDLNKINQPVGQNDDDDFFSRTWDSLRLAGSSVNLMYSMIDKGLSNIGLGIISNTFSITVLLLITAAVMFMLLYAAIKVKL